MGLNCEIGIPFCLVGLRLVPPFHDLVQRSQPCVASVEPGKERKRSVCGISHIKKHANEADWYTAAS